MDIKFEPLQTWPYGGTGRSEKRSPFKAAYPRTLELLKSELEHLRATSVAVQTGHDPNDIRQDGWPRVNARIPRFHGVCINFLKFVPSGKRNAQGQSIGRYDRLEFPCSTFDHWEDNLRAIALTLKSLRDAKKYGVGSEVKDQHYAGFAANRVEARAASSNPSGEITPEAAASILAACAGHGFNKEAILNNREMMETAYIMAAKQSHPDTGGTHNQMVSVSTAAKVLRAHHKPSPIGE